MAKKEEKQPALINPALEKMTVAISELHPDDKNARTHSDKNVQAIQDSLRQFGQQKPIIALTDGTIIAGNGTFKAAKKLGWDRIAVVRFENKKQAKAFAIADNRTAELADWDVDELNRQLASLKEFDLGFTEQDLKNISLGIIAQKNGEAVDPDAEWAGMPTFSQQDLGAFRSILVHFKTQKAVDEFAKAIKLSITKNTRYMWFPKEENIDAHSVGFKVTKAKKK